MEIIENSLELLLDWDDGLPLGMAMSISISMLNENWSNVLDNRALVVVDNVLFANSLIDATIQDDGKRERSDVYEILS